MLYVYAHIMLVHARIIAIWHALQCYHSSSARTPRPKPSGATAASRPRTERSKAESKRELEYWIPRLYSPVNSRRFPDIFGYVFCSNKKTLPVGTHGKPLSPVCSGRFP